MPVRWSDDVTEPDPAAAGERANRALVLRQRLRRVAAVCAGAVALALGVALVVPIVVSPPSEHASEGEVAAALPSDPLAALPDGVAARLTQPEVDAEALFVRVFAGDPRDLCNVIEEFGVPMSDWAPDPVRDGHWQCASDLVGIGRETPAGVRTTLFVSLRGRGERRLDFVRIKLNGDNHRTVGRAKEALRRILTAVAERYGWDWPPELYGAVDDGRSLALIDRGVRLTVRREDPGLTNQEEPVLRLNVVIDFPEHELTGADVIGAAEWQELPSAHP